MQQRVDVLVVGGGPVGLVTAICVALQGLHVVVIEQRSAPYDKCCGEGIMPGGVRALREIGLDFAAKDYFPFAGIRYIDGPHRAEASFLDGPGWGLRRVVLMAALVQRARSLGIMVHENCRLESWSQDGNGVTVQSSAGRWQAQTLIGADGLHSALRRSADLDLPAHARPKRFGVRRHFAIAPWSPYVEVHWAAGCEAYVTPVAADAVGVAVLWGPKPAAFDGLLKRFAGLAGRLDGVQVTSRLRGAGTFYQPVRRRYHGRLALVGDAAGYCDALTGEGLTLGFRCAQALAQTLAAGQPLAEYERAYKRLSAAYYRETTWLLRLAARPRLRRQAVRLLERYPRLLRACVTAHGRQRLVRPQDFF